MLFRSKSRQLIFTGKHGRAHQALQISRGAKHSLKSRKTIADLVDGFCLGRQLKERCCVSARHTGNCLICGCHDFSFETVSCRGYRTQPKHLIFLINPLHKAKARNRTPPCRGVSVTQALKTGNRLNRADCRNAKVYRLNQAPKGPRPAFGHLIPSFGREKAKLFGIIAFSRAARMGEEPAPYLIRGARQGG